MYGVQQVIFGSKLFRMDYDIAEKYRTLYDFKCIPSDVVSPCLNYPPGNSAFEARVKPRRLSTYQDTRGFSFVFLSFVFLQGVGDITDFFFGYLMSRALGFRFLIFFDHIWRSRLAPRFSVSCFFFCTFNNTQHFLLVELSRGSVWPLSLVKPTFCLLLFAATFSLFYRSISIATTENFAPFQLVSLSLMIHISTQIIPFKLCFKVTAPFISYYNPLGNYFILEVKLFQGLGTFLSSTRPKPRQLRVIAASTKTRRII